jgi:hypothetical protein
MMTVIPWWPDAVIIAVGMWASFGLGIIYEKFSAKYPLPSKPQTSK